MTSVRMEAAGAKTTSATLVGGVRFFLHNFIISRYY